MKRLSIIVLACCLLLLIGVYSTGSITKTMLIPMEMALAEEKNDAADTVTLEYTKTVKDLAREILMEAGKPYSEAQLKEIPNILNAKARYFWGNDLNDYELLLDVFTEDGFEAYWSGYPGATTAVDQIEAVKASIGQGDMVPMHFGHNQVVYFIDDTHCRLLTRMNDYHTYTDNGETYAGYGMYVDDLVKCDDGVWRIQVLRLDYGVLINTLRSQRTTQ